jgi:hypothetical protein
MTRVTWTTALALGELLSPGLLLSLALILPRPAAAQTNPPPVLAPTQQLIPTNAEIYPTPGSVLTHVGFGAAIAVQRDTALISELGYLPNAGRVALFKRGASGQWERDGSIDPASTPGVYGPAYGFGLAIALRDDYALIMSTTANYLYRKDHDQWTQLDLLPGLLSAAENGQTIEPPFVFINGNIYRIGPQGKLQQTQTLADDNPSYATGFGNAVAVSDGTLVVTATGDNDDRGALYTFEHRGGVWVKTQKIVANDGEVGDELGDDVAISGDIIVAAAGGKDYDYLNPNCNSQTTSGVIYIFARVRGVWTQQQEIVNPCVGGFQVVALDHEWLSVSGSFALTQTVGTLVYRRENRPWSSNVSFVPYGTVNSNGYQGTPFIQGSTLFSEDGGYNDLQAGAVNVYELGKGRW